MTTKPRPITDAASEFAKTMQLLLSTDPKSGQQSQMIVAGMLYSPDRSYPVIDAYAAMNRRADTLLKVIKSISDHDIDENVRDISLRSIRGMQEIFSPKVMFSNWENALATYLTKDRLLSLAFLAPVISRHYPLPTVSNEELTDLIENLMDAQEELSSSASMPDWAKSALDNSVKDLLFVLQNFTFFGHDEAVSKLVTLIGTATAVAREAEAAGTSFGLGKLLKGVALAVSLFAAPYAVTTAFQSYRGWANGMLETLTPLLSPPPKQIEGPKPPPSQST